MYSIYFKSRFLSVCAPTLSIRIVAEWGRFNFQTATKLEQDETLEFTTEPAIILYIVMIFLNYFFKFPIIKMDIPRMVKVISPTIPLSTISTGTVKPMLLFLCVIITGNVKWGFDEC